jgi:hypothetical protein
MRYLLLVPLLFSCAACNLHNPVGPFATVTPRLVRTLGDTLHQTSGLIYWNDAFWSHNDAEGDEIFSLDSTGRLKRIVNVYRATYGNWEDMAQDDEYIYIANTGNNKSGSRTNLAIYRIPKNELLKSDTAYVSADSILYRYAEQTDFKWHNPEETNFDCEAMMAYGDSLYLFTKQWLKEGTTIYAVPKKPGNYKLLAGAKLPIKGLITGAASLPEKGIVALCGYTTNKTTYIDPFVLVLCDYKGTDFFSGQINRYELDAAFHQVEAIALTQDGRCFITNEKINRLFINISPKLMEVKLPELRKK